MTLSRRQTRAICLFWGATVWPIAGVKADHTPARAGLPVRLESAAGADPLRGATATAQTQVGLSARYLQFRPPAVIGARPPRQTHGLVNTLRGDYAFSPRLALGVQLPALLTFGTGNSNTAAGLGDVGLGVRALPIISTSCQCTVDIRLNTRFPTGNKTLGFSAEQTITRASSLYIQTLGPGRAWTISLGAGLSWAWSAQTNLVLDYGASGRYALLRWLGGYLDARAQTFLRDSPRNFNALSQRRRGAGETAVVLSPGLSLRPVSGLWLAVGPQIPLTRVKDFDMGAALTATYTPSF